MWKKEDAKPQGVSDSSSEPINSSKMSSAAPSSTPTLSATAPASTRGSASISQGIRIKGEVTGSEDLYVDGLVDGKLNLTNGSLTIGPNGSVKADVNAREVIVRGKVEGKVTGRDKVQLWSTGQITGEVQTERLSIEEGAVLKGKVEAGKQPTAKASEIKAAAAGASKSSEATTLSSGTAAD
jgi:cytoskeletal protein CcmA (bactofilin family)